MERIRDRNKTFHSSGDVKVRNGRNMDPNETHHSSASKGNVSKVKLNRISLGYVDQLIGAKQNSVVG